MGIWGLGILRPSHAKPKAVTFFVDPMLEKTTEKYWLGRDGEKHIKLCLDVSQSS